MIYAKVIADSISTRGDRLVTIEAKFHRFILAEVNTHRSIAKSSASSRAIPIEKRLEELKHLAVPVSFPAEQRGMSGGEELHAQDLWDAEDLWYDAADATLTLVEKYLEGREKSSRVHKSVIARLLEPFLYHTAIMTATIDGWNNLFFQRCHKDAQPEFKAVAEKMQQALIDSTPQVKLAGQWHLPYLSRSEQVDIPMLIQQKVSAARCARVSYLSFSGVRDIIKDVELYDKLVSHVPMHASPLEHVATPALGPPTKGCLVGWRQLRHQVEDELRAGSSENNR